MEKTKKNWFIRLWNYYSTYEKCWLISICSIGILFGILFPESEGTPTWLRVVEIIAIVGGCSCELLLSKQSKWAFIVSFILYDTTQTVVYFANGLYVSALFELIFWIPMLFISFFFWEKKTDNKNRLLTTVKDVNYKRDLYIFLGLLALSVGVGYGFTQIGVIAEGMPDYWILDALANTFSVCNGIFLLMRFREQWIPWVGVAIVEAVLWILSGQFIMLVLSVGYLMNSTYGFIKWTKYIKVHPEARNETFFGKPLPDGEKIEDTKTEENPENSEENTEKTEKNTEELVVELNDKEKEVSESKEDDTAEETITEEEIVEEHKKTTIRKKKVAKKTKQDTNSEIVETTNETTQEENVETEQKQKKKNN